MKRIFNIVGVSSIFIPSLTGKCSDRIAQPMTKNIYGNHIFNMYWAKSFIDLLIFTKQPVSIKKAGIKNDKIELFIDGYMWPKFTICTRITKLIRMLLNKLISLLCFMIIEMFFSAVLIFKLKWKISFPDMINDKKIDILQSFSGIFCLFQ